MDACRKTRNARKQNQRKIAVQVGPYNGEPCEVVDQQQSVDPKTLTMSPPTTSNPHELQESHARDPTASACVLEAVSVRCTELRGSRDAHSF